MWNVCLESWSNVYRLFFPFLPPPQVFTLLCRHRDSFTSLCRQCFSPGELQYLLQTSWYINFNSILHYCHLKSACLWCERDSAHQSKAIFLIFESVSALFQRCKINGRNGIWPAPFNQHCHCNEEHPVCFCDCISSKGQHLTKPSGWLSGSGWGWEEGAEVLQCSGVCLKSCSNVQTSSSCF